MHLKTALQQNEDLNWIHEAGNPYYDWLFGSYEKAHKIISFWNQSIESEISYSRTRNLISDGNLIGGFISLSGSELRKTRKTDLLILMKHLDKQERPQLMNHLNQSSDLFLPIEDDEYYLSKIGVKKQYRGNKFGTVLLGEFVNQGMRCGYSDFKLDVNKSNASAVSLYRRYGFSIVGENESHDGELHYYRMSYSCEKEK